MKYFTDHLPRMNPSSTTTLPEIDVHCDISVFNWLVKWIDQRAPKLEVKIAVSILLSSNFLQMKELFDECLGFIHDHINKVLEVPIDMSCLHGSLAGKLALKFTMAELTRIHDPQDKLLNALCQQKLFHLLSSNGINLQCCRYCRKVYSKNHVSKLYCPKGRVEIGLHGEIQRLHERDTRFNINQYTAYLVNKGYSWKKILFMMWSITTHLTCQTCDQVYSVDSIYTCAKHDCNKPSVYPSDVTRGYWQCCDQDYQLFELTPLDGCTMTSHVAIENDDDDVVKFVMGLFGSLEWAPHSFDLGGDVVSTSSSGSSSDISSDWIQQTHRPFEQFPSPVINVTSSSGRIHLGGANGKRRWTGPKKPNYIQREEDSARIKAMSNFLIQMRRPHPAMV